MNSDPPSSSGIGWFLTTVNIPSNLIAPIVIDVWNSPSTPCEALLKHCIDLIGDGHRPDRWKAGFSWRNLSYTRLSIKAPLAPVLRNDENRLLPMPTQIPISLFGPTLNGMPTRPQSSSTRLCCWDAQLESGWRPLGSLNWTSRHSRPGILQTWWYSTLE